MPHAIYTSPVLTRAPNASAVWAGTAAVSLLELATGSVQQEVTFSERDGRTTIESYRLNFHVHFQENFAFVMRLTDWSGSKLRSTDETGSSDPFLRTGARRAFPPPPSRFPSPSSDVASASPRWSSGPPRPLFRRRFCRSLVSGRWLTLRSPRPLDGRSSKYWSNTT